VSDLGAEVGDAASVAVHQQKGLPATIDLVVESHAAVGKGMAGGRVGAVSDSGCGRLGCPCLSSDEARN